MKSKVADSIRRGLEEAIAYVEGTADPSRYNVHTPGRRKSPQKITYLVGGKSGRGQPN